MAFETSRAVRTGRSRTLEREPEVAICRGELLYAALCGPFERRFREAARELGEIDPVAARIRRRVARERDLALRKLALDDVCEVADPVVLLRASDVERLSWSLICRARPGA